MISAGSAYLALAELGTPHPAVATPAQVSRFLQQNPFSPDDDQFLEELEKANFLYFWEQANPASGMVRDRANVRNPDNSVLSSIAATGFGLTALCIGSKRGFISYNEARARTLTTLRFLWTKLPEHRGFFYHWANINTGERLWESEVSSIDTAILLCGVLTCREYFRQHPEIADLAYRIYNRIDWSWLSEDTPILPHGWTPESGFLPYSQAWFDFRGKRDRYADYFQNSILATDVHRRFCLQLAKQFPDYSDDLWGITASDSMHGYAVWGGPPLTGPIDGTVVPCAAAGSLPFLPQPAMRVLRTIKNQYGTGTWSRYGFVDAFNPLKNWYDTDVIGIDTGITMVMAENARTGFVWDTFMRNPEAQRAMERAGFRSYQPSLTQETGLSLPSESPISR